MKRAAITEPPSATRVTAASTPPRLCLVCADEIPDPRPRQVFCNSACRRSPEGRRSENKKRSASHHAYWASLGPKKRQQRLADLVARNRSEQQRAVVSAAKNEQVELECEFCGARVKRSPSQVFEHTFCSHHHRGLWLWEQGRWSKKLVNELWRPETRRRKLGHRASRKPPAPGGLPRGRPRIEVTQKQRTEIELLDRRGWGRPAIATATSLSDRVVRRVLSEIRA